MQRQKFLWNALVDYWFRMELDGWENLPDARRCCWWAFIPARRSSGTPGPSGCSGGAGSARSARCTALRTTRLMAIPVIGRYFRAMGVLPAAPDSIATALAEGRDVALWPGGEVDSLRPWRSATARTSPAARAS